MSNSNAELIARLQQHDVGAFDALYWQYHEVVYRNILKFTKDAIAAEDILQEVFIKLWEKRHTIKTEQSVAGWLFVISFNLSVNHTRKRLREQTLQKKLAAIEPDSGMPAGIIRYEEQYQLLESAIQQLSPQKRKVVTLCKLEGKTYEEAAGELKISRNTVKEHLQAAMVNLNDYIRKKAHIYIAFFVALLND
ncbi:sigma-70 family RNA polymerase sigma factor [Pseudoflavitalea sp. X16]|uniref:RNA polymerase sigma factor n=1 Tax=Paraflavitalea devenefica TaxID=2716334 RepID=UPI00141FBF44|nr:sigma-70 family RNA polymerase sigma factor [Paraflavitalea devenefica]NII27897.1 sigma-70 family RNA polymerase sigma factor [Paraflavitalea devenefica]